METDQQSIERWRGHVDSQLHEVRKAQETQAQKFELVDMRVQKIELKVEMLATKLVIYSALGATVGSAIVSIVVGIILRVVWGHG